MTTGRLQAEGERVREILTLREAGYVRRWHTMAYVAGDQNDAEHSAQALSLLLMLHPSPSLAMIKVLLWHDMGEIFVGDSPAYPALRENEDLRTAYKSAESRYISLNYPELNLALGELTEDDHQWIRECDILELCLFARDQLRRGNEDFYPVMDRGLKFLDDLWEKVPLHEPIRDFRGWVWKKNLEEDRWEIRLTTSLH